MMNNEGQLERRMNKITLRALREKVKIQCEVVRKGITDMESQRIVSVENESKQYSTISVKVSIK